MYWIGVLVLLAVLWYFSINHAIKYWKKLYTPGGDMFAYMGISIICALLWPLAVPVLILVYLITRKIYSQNYRNLKHSPGYGRGEVLKYENYWCWLTCIKNEN